MAPFFMLLLGTDMLCAFGVTVAEKPVADLS
jgi:hypothetical protein